MEKKISIIIPVYNTVKEIEKCLSSICNQSYKNLEIICIDDGSYDGTEQIIDCFAANDCRFIVVHQKNAGESNARNEGLKRATGDYIAFCDCDDWLDKEMYELLLTLAENNKLDIAASSWYKELEGETEFVKNRLSVKESVFGQEELLQYIYKRDDYRAFAYMWDKLYKREIVSGLKFDETLRLGGDVVFLAQAALRAKRIMYLDKCLYHYNQRPTSGCHTKNLDKWKDWIRSYAIIINMFEKEDVSLEVIQYAKRFLAYHSSNAAEIAIEQNDIENFRYFQTYMIKYEKEYRMLNQIYPQRIERYVELMQKEI